MPCATSETIGDQSKCFQLCDQQVGNMHMNLMYRHTVYVYMRKLHGLKFPIPSRKKVTDVYQ